MYPVDLIISIVSSNDQAPVEALRAKGHNVFVPPSFDDMNNELRKDVLRALECLSYPVVLQEVGGYMSRWTNELLEYGAFNGCIEDAKNGLWRFQDAEEKGRLLPYSDSGSDR